MKLIKISGRLDKNGFTLTEKVLEATETKKIYVIKECNNPNLLSGNKNINKDELLIPDTMFTQSHRLVNWFIYALEADKEKAEKILKNKIISEATEIYTASLAMFSHITKTY